MEPLYTQITPIVNNSLHVDLRNQPFFSSPFHAHPELELVFIMEGFGKRIIGNKIEPFVRGDMVFIGSNLPHVWLSDSSFYKENLRLESKAIVTYFNPATFQHFFEGLKELALIREIIQKASKGIRIWGKTRNVIANNLLELPSKTGYEKIERFLLILHLISTSQEISFITNDENNSLEQFDSDRLIDVINFVKANLNGPISLKQVAEIACLTEQSFCRFFKNRTNKSFSQFVEELRMDRASELLIRSSSTSIADIGYACGYNFSSHFGKVFKKHFGCSPRQYKSSIIKQPYRNSIQAL